MFFFASSDARGALRWAALAASALVGCPQLLDDQFGLASSLPGTGLTSGGGDAGLAGDAGSGSGAGGAGGGAAGAGAGGDPSDAGRGGSSALDASATAGSGSGGTEAGSPDGGVGPGAVLREALLHRYSFDGTGTAITDSISDAHGAAIGGATLDGSGQLTLSGTGQYVNLPNRLISGLESVTLEAWVNWLVDPTSPDADWQSIFSFGASDGGEDVPGDGVSYLCLSAQSGDTGDIHAAYTAAGFPAEIVADGERALPASADLARGTHVALVVDAAQGSLAIYVEGALEAASPPGQAIDLSLIDDVNDWLGRTQYDADPDFAGALLEFRIYGSALSAEQLQLSFDGGPNAAL